MTEPRTLGAHQQAVDDLSYDQRCEDSCVGGRIQKPDEPHHCVQQARVQATHIDRLHLAFIGADVAGLAAFAARRENRSGGYSYEQRPPTLVEPYAGLMRKNPAASKFFEAQPPSYQKLVTWWVISAKQEATRLARLAKLIEACATERRL